MGLQGLFSLCHETRLLCVSAVPGAAQAAYMGWNVHVDRACSTPDVLCSLGVARLWFHCMAGSSELLAC